MGFLSITKLPIIVWKHWHDASTWKLWIQWATGVTGLPLVDAALREMIQTGYCSNRVRQNAASVLAKDLGIDWRAGAEWFQFLLCDHCVGANWGNWLYFAGVGNDPKNRHFRTVSQALKYDKDGAYVKKWLPELTEIIATMKTPLPLDVRNELHLRPWDFVTETNLWKQPIVSPDTQYTWHDLERLKRKGQLYDDTSP
jgi:deoxyribodipyrimidine photolyase